MSDEVHDERRVVVLTEQQMDAIAERAANKVFERIYSEVGKSVLRKFAWALGVITVALLIWAAGKGALPK